MATQPLGPMSAGEVLDRSFQLYRRHFRVLFVTTASAFAVLALMYVVAGVPMATVDPEAGAGVMAVLMIPLLVITLGIWGALAHQLGRAFTEGDAGGVGEGLRRGLASTLSLVTLGILAYLVLVGLVIPVGIVMAIAVPIGGVAGVAIAVAAGGALFIWAMVFWGSMVFVALPALVIERLGPIAALRRGRSLVKGSRLRVVAMAIVAWLVVMLPLLGVYLLLGMGSVLWDPQAVATLSTTQLFLQQTVAFASGVFTTPYLVAVAVLVYFDRRFRREGYDVELAASPALSNG